MSRCQSCGEERAVQPVVFRMNVSYLIARSERELAGRLCRTCTTRTFLHYEAATLVGTWWGMIGCIVGPWYLLSNIAEFCGAWLEFARTKKVKPPASVMSPARGAPAEGDGPDQWTLEGRHDRRDARIDFNFRPVSYFDALPGPTIRPANADYLPMQREGEVVIAWIELSSTLNDVVCLLARPADGAIALRMVDDVHGQLLDEPTERIADRPLTLQELADFFLGAFNLLELLERNELFDIDQALGFFKASSPFYPQFADYCRQMVTEALPERDEDDRDDAITDPFLLAHNAMQRGDYGAAFAIWAPLAEAGNPDAQFNLGYLYGKGSGVPQDHAEAARWYRLSAEQGNVHAQFNLGMAFYEGRGVSKDLGEAAKWWTKAADRGEPRSQLRLGRLYAKGEGVAQSYPEARRWFRLSADQGNHDAQENLGILFLHGLGTHVDYLEAFKWFRLAANDNSPAAQYALGYLYMKGLGAPQDGRTAYGWFLLAAKQGDGHASFNIALLYSRGEGVEKDDVKAYMWLSIAERNGVTDIEKEAAAISAKLTNGQKSRAKQMASDCIASNYARCS